MVVPQSPPIIPPVTSAAPDAVRELLTSRNWTDVATLAIETVKTQLSAHEARRGAHLRAQETAMPSLFDASTNSLVQSIGDDADEFVRALEALPLEVRTRALSKIRNIPYAIFCRAAHEESRIDGVQVNVDEWILHNETWLRDSSDPTTLRSGDSSKQTEQKPWSHGLVQLSTHADFVFPGSELTNTSRIITRPTSLPGFKVLDANRSPTIRIQPSVEMYSETFNTMTQSLLKGLNWDNVFVAGGIALGTLLCTTGGATNTPEQWEDSDVDLYIHGLGPVEANKKIEHVFSVFKSNLPESAPVLVVRNSKTITFFSKYPLRRIQVVLKLVASPKDVLLNFDLDICAVGWDGSEVWMLPRTVRALETGYTVFTTDLINGHYLGDRRATQEQRVFKYADKGYGIRILPSYLDALQSTRNDKQASTGVEAGAGSQVPDLDVEKIAQKAREWTLRAIMEFTKIKYPLAERRKPLPQMSHSWLEQKKIGNDPASKSCLSGLMSFMRHVALWEFDAAGEIFISNDIWAAPMYDNMYLNINSVSYNDSPDYLWDEDFDVEHFIPQIEMFNTSERDQLIHNFEALRSSIEIAMHIPIQRVSHNASVQKILEPDYDILLPVWIPARFVEFAEECVATAVRESGVSEYNTTVFLKVFDADELSLDVAPGICLAIWHVTKITMWQQLNRAIDEIHEVIWSFYRAYSDLSLEESTRTKFLLTQLGKRVIRRTARDEYGAFGRWVANLPAPNSYYSGQLWKVDQDQ